MSDTRQLQLLAAFSVGILLAYAASFASIGSPTLEFLLLGGFTLATLAVLALGTNHGARGVALGTAVVVCAATASLVWSYAHWDSVEASSFQTTAAGVWYAAFYLMLVLPGAVVVAAGVRIGRQLWLARRVGS